MSLLFHDQKFNKNAIRGALFCGLMFAASISQIANAQQTYFQPEAKVLVEYNTNRNLATDSQFENEIAGYRGELSGTWGYLTETSQSLIRPKIRFVRFQDRDELQRVEQFLDLKMARNTQKSQFSIFGKYSRRDAFTSELATAEFDDLDPDDITTPESAVVVGGTTRTRYRLRSDYQHRYSERTGFGVRLEWQSSQFDNELTGRLVDFEYLFGGLLLSHSIDPRTRIEVTPYVSKYEAGDNSNQTDATGVEFAWNRALSDRYRIRISARAERSDVEIRDAVTGVVVLSTDSTDYGPELSIVREGEVSNLRLELGREFTPTNRGSKSVTDQLRVQYQRQIRERLKLNTALRLFSATTQGDGGVATGRDYEYLNGVIGLEWAMTPTWFASGGYSYNHRDEDSILGSANNNNVFLQIRYQGLGPQR